MDVTKLDAGTCVDTSRDAEIGYIVNCDLDTLTRTDTGWECATCKPKEKEGE